MSGKYCSYVLSLSRVSAHGLNDVLGQAPGPEAVRGVGGGHEVLGAGDVAVHLRLVLPVVRHDPRVARVYGHAPAHQPEAPESLAAEVHHHVGAVAGAHRPHPPGAPLHEVRHQLVFPVRPVKSFS